MNCSVISEAVESDRTMFNHICGNERNEEARTTEKMEFTNDIGMNFKLIPAGELNMGSRGWKDSQPCHRVFIAKPFFIGTYPVTQWEWETIMGYNPSHFKGDERPVEMVSWRDCKTFIDYLNMLEDTGGYRLPSEAEWEYACRAGATTSRYFGNGESLLHEYAVFRAVSGNQPQSVATRKPNDFGLFDMHGNVAEWCQGHYRPYSQDGSIDSLDSGEIADGDLRVLRGGSFRDPSSRVRSAAREKDRPSTRNNTVGFRVARSYL